MANNNNTNSPPQSPPSPGAHRRRSSIADLFQPRSTGSANSNNSGTPAFPSAMSQALQNRSTPNRRVSISTSIGLSGSPTSQNSPFGNFGRRRGSIASSQDSGSPNNEDVLLEENEGPNPANTPASPFARRVSFGAQAFGSVKSGGGSFSNGTRRPSHSPLTEKPSNTVSKSPPPATTPGKSRGLSLSLSGFDTLLYKRCHRTC